MVNSEAVLRPTKRRRNSGLVDRRLAALAAVHARPLAPVSALAGRHVNLIRHAVNSKTFAGNSFWRTGVHDRVDPAVGVLGTINGNLRAVMRGLARFLGDLVLFPLGEALHRLTPRTPPI